MLVAITGGSGFVGSHTVARLVAKGHRPRLLVRDPAKALRTLAGHDLGERDVDLVAGDMLDTESVTRLLDGADAAIHAAAAIGITGGSSGGMLEQNVTGTRNVLGGAVEAGLDPIVHISTVAVFVPPDGPRIHAGSRLASPRTEYGKSKLAAEHCARELQDGGAPLTILYPGGVLGPGQPQLDAMMEGLAGALSAAWPMPKGGVGIIDVRDLAEVIVRSVEPGHGARRMLIGGDFLTWPQLADLCDEVTGVKCRRLVVPGPMMIGLGALLDAAKRIRAFDYPLTRDAAEIMVTMVPTDDAPTLAALDCRLRPVRDTVEDALRILAAEGHLAPDKAGRLAPS